MGTDKEALLKAINDSVRELQKGIDMHCCLVTSILNEQVDPRSIEPLLELCPSKSREIALKEAVKEAIEVLEESRKAFKSKQLEKLRKRLTRVLIDTG